jgi:predicted  nucleic acid-binding Zn-ribbon protein
MVCLRCGDAYDKGRSKSNLCPSCRQRESRIRAAQNRKAKESVMRDCGLVKVRGALGGVYWE